VISQKAENYLLPKRNCHPHCRQQSWRKRKS